jgi:hypothetical protein
MREIIQEDPKRIKIGIDETNAFEKKKEVSVFSEKISCHLTKANDLFCQMAVPVAVVKDITYSQFQIIYSGQGKNEQRTPLNDLMTKEAVYFLFALTLGPGVSKQILNLFSKGDYLLGNLFDLVCSIGIEAFADDVIKKYFTREVSRGRLKDSDIMLRYSPGYCGWHITGQKMLHEHLQSCGIGITLTEAFYMKPMKSISGVIVGCNPSMHNFNNDYTFCGDYRTKTCRKRLVVNGIQNNI